MRNQRIASTAIVALACAGMAACSATELAPPPAESHQLASVTCAEDAYAREVGDDNCDGTIDEDESGWNCATMGNHVCGPNATPTTVPEWCWSELADTYAPEWGYTPGSRIYFTPDELTDMHARAHDWN